MRKALDAGWDPVELRERHNAAVAEKRSAAAALAALSTEQGLSREELETYVDQLGDISRAFDTAEPEELNELYSSLRLSLTYHHAKHIVEVEVDPLADRVDKYRVRGATRTLTTRLDLSDYLSGVSTVGRDL